MKDIQKRRLAISLFSYYLFQRLMLNTQVRSLLVIPEGRKTSGLPVSSSIKAEDMEIEAYKRCYNKDKRLGGRREIRSS
jgi:hypothetical protein